MSGEILLYDDRGRPTSTAGAPNGSWSNWEAPALPFPEPLHSVAVA